MLYGRHDWGSFTEMYNCYTAMFKAKDITEIEYLSHLMKLGFTDRDAKSEANVHRPED